MGKERLNQRILQDRVPDVIYVYTYKVRILTLLQNIRIYVLGSRNVGIVFYIIFKFSLEQMLVKSEVIGRKNVSPFAIKNDPWNAVSERLSYFIEYTRVL